MRFRANMKTVHTAVTAVAIVRGHRQHAFASQHAVQGACRAEMPAPAVFDDQ